MGLSSLSPANSACLTTSLSRRLRTSGPANTPMFGAYEGRKRSGSGRENKNVEPSSPKVTCIGQVRVKTRKHVKKTMRARSRREGQTSLRRSSSDQNDGGGRRFVHLPVTICESLRALGSELNCLFPCRSSCTDNTHHNRDQVENNGGGNSCVAVFTRWFVAVEESRREIELVVGGEDVAEEDSRRSRRRHVFENLDLSIIETKTEKKERDDGGRINIRSPPKNALLLMRCRSDPVKVAALANRVRERQMSLNDVAYGREDEEDNERRKFELNLEDKKRIELCEKWISDKTIVETQVIVPVVEPEVVKDLSVEEDSNVQEVDSFEEETEAMIIKTIRNAMEEEERKEVVERSDQGNQEPDPSPEMVMKVSQLEKTTEKETPSNKVLPDCLLLMMCEPKLSMEVSKETWVCSTDFVRCQPGRRPPAKTIPEPAGDHHHHQPKKIIDSNASSRRRSVDKRPVHQALLQPPRSSCSYPAAPPEIQADGAVGEQKFAGANKAYEPPMLPRCKSEPRKSASKLAPETCLWENLKLKPHSPATVGAAGVGF